jgi:hypothetical protein
MVSADDAGIVELVRIFWNGGNAADSGKLPDVLKPAIEFVESCASLFESGAQSA